MAARLVFATQPDIEHSSLKWIVVKIVSLSLRAQLKQIAHEGLQKNRPRTVDVKVTAGKHSYLTGSHGHLAPGRRPSPCHVARGRSLAWLAAQGAAVRLVARRASTAVPDSSWPRPDPFRPYRSPRSFQAGWCRAFQ
jgi:hypothetical protein